MRMAAPKTIAAIKAHIDAITRDFDAYDCKGDLAADDLNTELYRRALHKAERELRAFRCKTPAELRLKFITIFNLVGMKEAARYEPEFEEWRQVLMRDLDAMAGVGRKQKQRALKKAA